MKTLVKVQTKVEGKQVTITGELMDVQFPAHVAQRMSVGHFVSTNPHRPRRCMATNHAFILERHGADGFAIPLDEFVAIGLEIDPKLSDAPLIQKHPTEADMILECKTETPAKQQWQVSDDGKTWNDLESVPTTPQPGKHYRVVLTNQSGSTESKSFSVKPPKANK